MEHIVRAALVEDTPQIGQIHVDGWRIAYRGIVPDVFLAQLSAEKRAAGWKFAIENDPRSVFVFERNETVVGWAAIGKSREGIEGAGEVFAVYVDPASWRLGCGLKLMEAAEAELWHRGYSSIVLWVLEKNQPARAFYQRIGYADDGGRKTEQIDGTELIEVRMAKQRPSGR